MGQQNSVSHGKEENNQNMSSNILPNRIRVHSNPDTDGEKYNTNQLSYLNQAPNPNRNRIASFGSDEWFHGDIDGIRSSPSDPYMNSNAGHVVLSEEYNPNSQQLSVITSHLHSTSGRLQSNNRIAILLSKFPPSAEVPPDYILESSIENQYLWYLTAGKRPPQPVRVKELVEQLWAKNYKLSEVNYNSCADDILPELYGCQEPEQYHGSVHSSTVSKSFNLQTTVRSVSNNHVNPHENRSVPVMNSSSLIMTMQVPKYRIVCGNEKNNNNTKSFLSSTSSLQCSPCCAVSTPSCGNTSVHSCICCTRDIPRAEYLVVVSLGGDHPVTLGFWKRHSDFKMIADRLLELCHDHGDMALYNNSLLSWQCVLARQKWYRCLEPEYLSFKCHLLERFVHDLLFESNDPNLILHELLGLSIDILSKDA